jgi:tripartite ATP-independent transporter DctM subunit
VIYASIANMSVGQLYAGMLLPGLLMVGMFLVYIVARCVFYPQDGPPVARSELEMPLGEKIWLTVTGFVPAVVLIAAVLGSTMFGIASPTEAASVGALFALLLAILYRRMTWPLFVDAVRRTLLINCMIMLIVVGGTMFASVFRVQGGEKVVQAIVADLDIGSYGVVLICLAIVFVAGFILDWVSIVLICLPIFMPIVAALKIDPVWFAVLMVVSIQTSYLTPPMAPSIFYLKSIAPPEITYRDMARGVLPFVIVQATTLLALLLLPQLATYLPSQLKGF